MSLYSVELDTSYWHVGAVANVEDLSNQLKRTCISYKLDPQIGMQERFFVLST